MTDSHVMTLPDGRDLGWLEFGRSDGWPIFGFHGTPGSRLQLGIDEGAVRRAGVRLIAPDRPGYGLSTFQPARRLVDWPADVVHLADHLAIDRFSVMGVSGGGPHAAVCAALLSDRVDRAGLVSGAGPLSDWRIAADSTRSTRLVTTLSRNRSKVLRRFIIAEVAFARRWPTKTLDLMAKQLPPYDAEVIGRPDLRALFVRDVSSASRTSGRAHAQDLELFASDWGFNLGDIKVPVLFWHGDADKNVPLKHAQVMHKAIPGSVLNVFEGEGHLLVANRLEEILLALKAK
jgi:pimeloyl-ACP methyl ester carboxylesterase